MADAHRRYTDDVPEDIEVRVRELCLGLPDAYEERAWVGTRWMVRKRTFAHVLGVEVGHGGPLVVLSFRSAGEELEILRHAGHPFFVLGWGRRRAEGSRGSNGRSERFGTEMSDATIWRDQLQTGREFAGRIYGLGSPGLLSDLAGLQAKMRRLATRAFEKMSTRRWR